MKRIKEKKNVLLYNLLKLHKPIYCCFSTWIWIITCFHHEDILSRINSFRFTKICKGFILNSYFKAIVQLHIELLFDSFLLLLSSILNILSHWLLASTVYAEKQIVHLIDLSCKQEAIFLLLLSNFSLCLWLW